MEKVAHCHLIAKVLAADGIMESTERDFLERAMTWMGLTDEERDRVIHFEGAEGAEAAFKDLPIEDRQALVDELIEAALVDGKLSPHETAIVKRIGAALGL